MDTKSCLDEQKIAIDLFLKPSQEIKTNPSSGGSYLSYIKSKYSQSDSLLPNIKAEIICKNKDNNIDSYCNCKFCGLKSWLIDCEKSGTSLDHTSSKIKSNNILEINDDDNYEITLPSTISGGGGFESPVMIKVDNFFESEDDDEISCDYIPSCHFDKKINNSILTNTQMLSDIDKMIMNEFESGVSDTDDENTVDNRIDNTKLNINLESMISKKLPTIRSDADVFLQCYMKQLELSEGNIDNYSNDMEDIQTINDDDDDIIVEDINNNINNNKDNNDNNNGNEENIIEEDYDYEIINNLKKLNARYDDKIIINDVTIVEEF